MPPDPIIGDDDPEDSWDEADPPRVKLGVLERWLPSIRVEHEQLGHNHPRVVERIHEALLAVQKLSLERSGDLPLLETLGHIRDGLLELQQEEA